MSNSETTCLQRFCTFFGAEDPTRLLHQNRQLRMKDQKAIRDKQGAQKRAGLPTNVEQERENTFHIVADIVVSEEKPVTFEQAPVAPPTSDLIVVHRKITGILYRVEEAMKELCPAPSRLNKRESTIVCWLP